MSTINNTFSVRFNLANTLNLVLTDTTVSAPAGIVGFFTITQPDGSVRTGNVNSPDINAAGGSFTFGLNRASDGGVQCGTYTIKYTVTAPGYFSSDFTRSFVFQYSPVSLVIEEDFDVFTPNLSVRDNTTYAVSNFSAGSPTRSWTVSSTPTGTLTGSGATQSFAFGGQYYSANYTISLTSSILYTQSEWLTVQQTLSKSTTACIQPPPTFQQFVEDVSALKLELDQAVNTCQTYDKLKADFEYAITLLTHIINKIKTSELDNIYVDLNDLLVLLANNQIPACNPTNQVIPAYNIGGLDGTAWGTITGTIQLQTDLWAYLSDLISKTGQATESVKGIAELATQAETDAGTDDLRIVTPLKLKTLLDNRVGGYAATIGDGVNTSFALTHGLNTRDVVVAIYKVSTNEQVVTDVVSTSTSVVTVSFFTAPTTNSYRVVIKK